MKRRVLLSFLLIFAFAKGLRADPVDGLDFQSESVATAEFVTSGVINPAGLSFYSATGIHYTHNFTDSTYGGDDALLIGSRRGFFALQWLKHTTNQFRRKYTMAIGDRIAANFYAGISYSWFGGSIDQYRKMKDWKIGILYRPRPFVAFGFVADRLNQPRFGTEVIKRRYEPGIAVRPFGEKFTISSDVGWVEGDDIKRLEGSFRLAAGPFHGVRFSADYRAEGLWRIGLILDFEQARIGTQARLDNSRGYDGGGYFIELAEMRYPSSLGRHSRTGILTLNDRIAEEPEPKPFFGSAKNNFLQIITAASRGADDDRIDGLLLKIDGARMSLASAQEIREAIKEYRRNGKKTTVYIENGGDLDYYIASAADNIIMNPSGYLMLNGLAITATFYKGAMEKLGVRAQIIRTGPHKTAGDAFTEDSLTVEAEEQMNWLLDDLYQQMVEGISIGRKMLPDSVRNLIDNGPYTARGARDAGLIDELRYYDEIVPTDGAGFVYLPGYYKKEDFSPRWSEPAKIAVVYVDGAIVPGSSGKGVIQGKLAGGQTLAKSLAGVRRDGDIKAVVLRVDSPGGDLFGSDRIYRELELLKGKKPLVVSMGGVAASGGYYVSCPGDEIMASPGTITGSIGVIMGKADFSEFYEKIGFKKKTIKRGNHSDITSMDRPATEEEIRLAEKQIWQFYGDFVSKVSTWRKIDYASVDAAGQGRVWTGRQAKDRGLIDSYGGIWEAIERAGQKAGIDPDDKLIIETYPRRRPSLFRFPELSILDSSMESVLEETANIGWQLRMPFDLEIE